MTSEPVPANHSFNGSIVVVDDTPTYLLLLSKMLTGHNYDVRAIADGGQAIAEIVRNPPDIVALDVNMPNMDGYEVARRLKANPLTQAIPIIFISGLDANLDKVKAFTTGGVDYITKPFHIEEVLARIETHLTLTRLHKKLESANRALQDVNNTLEDRVRIRTAELEELNSALECFVPRESLRFLSKESLAQIQRGDHIEEEMTIMFADIRSFTEISDGMTPQENFDFINNYLNYVGPPISEHGGFIDKYTGDGIMAVFPNHPSDAIRAALAMQEQLRLFNGEREAEGKSAIRVGIGMHSGHVMFGTVGHPKRMDVTVISDAVNLAFRMQEMTKHFNTPIIASQSTIEMLGDSVHLFTHHPLGAAHVNGKSETVNVYALQPRDLANAILWAA